jgi:hypothetical protein
VNGGRGIHRVRLHVYACPLNYDARCTPIVRLSKEIRPFFKAVRFLAQIEGTMDLGRTG